MTPVETMRHYEPCWCRSGLKYKKCHRDRERQTPVNIFELEAKLVERFREGYCSHPDPVSDPCSGTIVKAHTVQKRGGISAIAEAGHVLTVKPTMKDMIDSEGDPSPRRIGVNSASVFPGFCNKHDTALFKPIEGKSLSLDKEAAFVFSYRAVAYERFSKEAQWKGSLAHREMDKGRSFFHQSMIQTYLHTAAVGLQRGRKDVGRWKKEFDNRLLSRHRDDFHFLTVRFASLLPVVAACAFHPEFDMQGNPLQRLDCEAPDLDHITLNVTSFEGRTIVVFGWIGNDDGVARALASSFIKVADDRKADALLRLLFVHTDNLFFRPSWWEALPAARQAVFRKLLKSGTGVQVRSGGELADDRASDLCATVAEMVSG